MVWSVAAGRGRSLFRDCQFLVTQALHCQQLSNYFASWSVHGHICMQARSYGVNGSRGISEGIMLGRLEGHVAEAII
jgi:hypothetical protein